MSTQLQHPWKLVAPWYRWRRQITEEQVASSPRGTRPSLQKFDAPSFVKGFLEDPQRSLRFKQEIDQVFTINLVPAPLVPSGSLAGRAVTLFRPKRSAPESAKTAELVPSGMRKLFLDTHGRHYLVVCSLHCDRPGFPRVRADEVCQAGFVVRRRHLRLPDGAKEPGAALLREIVAVSSRLAELDESTPLRASAARKRAESVRRLKAEGTFERKRADVAGELGELRARLKTWADDAGVQSVHEGWVPGAFPNVGSWEIVEDEPAALSEAVFPLYRLVANPDVAGHDAEGSTLYFGVVPTSSLDTTRFGTARFDSERVYEVRCFVRRHRPGCPRTEKVPDCHGELTWSLPTEPYRLAAAADLVGTSNFPITIQVPRLDELAAQAALAPAGRFSPVRVVQPEALRPVIAGTELSGGSVGGAQICFFAIPLITIIALFVLNLFLPIVVFLFGLWFLLLFKFCIPPSVSIDAGLQAELETMGKLELDVDASVSVKLSGEFGFVTAAELNDELKAQMSAYWASEEGLRVSDVEPGLSGMSNQPLVTMYAAARIETKLPDEEDPTGGSGRQVGPDRLYGLEYEPREARWELG